MSWTWGGVEVRRMKRGAMRLLPALLATQVVSLALGVGDALSG